MNFAGEFHIGYNITSLDPKTVASVVQYGMYGLPITDEATGYSLVYNQLYPFEGLQNYTSGIIHHVRLTGIISSVINAYFSRLIYSSQMTDSINMLTRCLSSRQNECFLCSILHIIGYCMVLLFT